MLIVGFPCFELFVNPKLWFTSINKTARILPIAREDEILCSMEFVQMLPKDIEFTIEKRGNVQFGH